MTIGVPRETFPGENRVALVPNAVPGLIKAGIQVRIESGAGVAAGYSDDAYHAAGAQIDDRVVLFEKSDIVACVRALGANLPGLERDLAGYRFGTTLVGMLDPLSDPEPISAAASKGIRAFALELLPRITRAQAMDVLSSQSNLAGYKAVLLAAAEVPKVLPMMTTAAGTITPARVLVVGAGVAGLQAIATARRLGAVVSAYDIRPDTRQQVESLGARFVDLGLDTEGTQDKGGYAKAMDEEFYRLQRKALAKVCADSDIVITTALIPGRRSPLLITKEAVTGMKPGSVVVDLAAERGGNCELTVADQVVDVDGVRVCGPTNLPATVPFHASALYSKNMTTFLNLLVREGEIKLDLEDEIIRETLLTDGGKVIHPRLREMLDLGGEA